MDLNKIPIEGIFIDWSNLIGPRVGFLVVSMDTFFSTTREIITVRHDSIIIASTGAEEHLLFRTYENGAKELLLSPGSHELLLKTISPASVTRDHCLILHGEYEKK